MSIIDRQIESYFESIEDRLYYLSNQELRRAALDDIKQYAQGIVKLVDFELDHNKRKEIILNIDLIQEDGS